MTTLYDDPDYDWKHLTVPQEHANNRQIAWPRGKVLGGSSAMNFSALVYPSKSDFDNWKKLGNQGWGSEDMAPYLKKFHRYQAADPELAKRMMMDDWVDEKAQGYDGPLPAAFTNELGPFVSYDVLPKKKKKGYLGFESAPPCCICPRSQAMYCCSSDPAADPWIVE